MIFVHFGPIVAIKDNILYIKCFKYLLHYLSIQSMLSEQVSSDAVD